MCTGKNGKIYAAISDTKQSRNNQKGNACVVCYDPYANRIKSLGTVKAVSLAASNWMANESQEKIHTHLFPTPEGKVWMATHDNAGCDEPGDDCYYSGIFYRGTHFYHADETNNDRLVDYSAVQTYTIPRNSFFPIPNNHATQPTATSGVAIEWYSILAMGLNPYAPNRLWTMTYPHGKFFLWDLKKDTVLYFGTSGSTDIRELFVDKQGCLYWINSSCRKWDPATRRLKALPGSGFERGGCMTYSHSYDTAYTISTTNGHVQMLDFINQEIKIIGRIPPASQNSGDPHAFRSLAVSRDGKRLFTVNGDRGLYQFVLATKAYSKILDLSPYMGSHTWCVGSNTCADTLGNLYFCVGKRNSYMIKVNLGKNLVKPLHVPSVDELSDERTGQTYDPQYIKAYPNPFKPGISISYRSGRNEGSTTLKVFTVHGKLVKILGKGNGINTVYWDGRDNLSKRVSHGTYVIELATPASRQTRKIVMLQ
jgi:hypothetical protein